MLFSLKECRVMNGTVVPLSCLVHGTMVLPAVQSALLVVTCQSVSLVSGVVSLSLVKTSRGEVALYKGPVL